MKSQMSFHPRMERICILSIDDTAYRWESCRCPGDRVSCGSGAAVKLHQRMTKYPVISTLYLTQVNNVLSSYKMLMEIIPMN